MKDLKALLIVKTYLYVKGSSLVALVIDVKYCLSIDKLIELILLPWRAALPMWCCKDIGN